VECKLRSVNFRRVSDPTRAFRPAFRVTGISDDWYSSNWDLWWRVKEDHKSDCDKFGNTLERLREVWVHLEVSPNQCGYYKHNLRDAWVHIDIHSEDSWRYMRLSRSPQAIDFPQRRIWCTDYWSVALLDHTSYHLLRHCIHCLATSWYQRKWQLTQTSMEVHWNNKLTKQSNDLNQTWCLCHPLLLPSHQGQQKQEHIIHQWCKEAGGPHCICWLFVPGEWQKLNSSVICLDLWYLTKV